MTAEKLIESLSLDLSDPADTIERLFCAAVLHGGVDAAAKILGVYNEWKGVLGIRTPSSINSREPGETPKICPDCGGPLRKWTPEAGSMFSAGQQAAERAGDYYCTACKSDVAKSGYKYFWFSQGKLRFAN